MGSISTPNTAPDDIGRLWKPAVHPKDGGKYPGFRPGLVEHLDGMVIERDAAVPMRDGIKIYVDIFRPEGVEGKLPTLMTWSPYGKHKLKDFDIFPNSGIKKGQVSRHAVWEGADPLYWTAQRGYAVVNGDCRGSWASEGDLTILSPQDAYDGYDAIEWIASQSWSNGRVGTCGVSYLAIVQWRIAQLRPPHLACINPWEGYTDAYRDFAHTGGIPETKFAHFTDWSCQFSFGQRTEAFAENILAHEMMDAYNHSKTADSLANVTTPAYVVADWGDVGMHTRGALNGFTQISSKQKWLEVHGQKKWQYYYQPSSLARQEEFYKRFLKDESSEVDNWPPVRIEVRDNAGVGHWHDEQEWPINRTRMLHKYLQAESSQLKDDLPYGISEISYDSRTHGSNATFVYTFKEETELTGSMRLRLWVSTSDGDDLDLFVQLDKLNESGKTLPFVYFSMIDDGPMALGWLRASHREMDRSTTHHNRPYMTHERKLPLRPNEIVPVDIEIVASSTRFLKGETLKITIAGTDIYSNEKIAQTALHEKTVNKGKHTLYTGSVFDSYLVMPVID